MIHIHMLKLYDRRGLKALIEEAAKATLQQQGADPHSELSIEIGDDRLLHALNRQHLGEDRPTDVLSFPLEEKNPESGEAYLGDIIISMERAAQQAEARGHSPEAELQLLIVHGMLHLLGYDHADKKEKQAMWAAQEEVLQGLGVEIDAGNFDEAET